ncbi:DUF2254 domain-containing protein [Rhodobacteraceae bacterium]|nr:DUF2254 domain-containing protein [Paracoccaceae bacterium]
MMSRVRWRFRQIMERIWVRVSAFGILGVITALGAIWIGRLMPSEFGFDVSADAIKTILKIIASSMLAVTTFSLSIMVTAFGAAQGSATPRAIALLQSDRVTQHVLASFIGAFVYSLVAIIALEVEIYGDGGRLILFGMTIAIVAMIVIMLLRWIQHLSEFGRLGDTASRVENAATAALCTRVNAPFLEGCPWQEPPVGAWAAMAPRIGHVQHVDIEMLHDVAQKHDCHIWLLAPPGAFVHPAQGILRCDALPEDAQSRKALEESLCEAFTIAHARSYSQDPNFGLRALSEIGSRALSPAVNDPGTGIDILGRVLQVLSHWHPQPATDVLYPRIYVPALEPQDLVRNGFDALARDGAGQVEVAHRLQEVLVALAHVNPAEFKDHAADMARRAATFSDAALDLEEDRILIRTMSHAVGDLPTGG